MKTLLNPSPAGILLSGLIFFSPPSQALELSGKGGGEILTFFQEAKSPEQHPVYPSVFVEPELYYSTGENSEIKAKLFYRYNANSPSQTRGDIRELMFYQYADEWEIHAGIGKVFWGTTESRHLVDVVNQIDLLESLDDEARLGQPMLQAKLIKAWGTLDIMLLAGFRPVEFGNADVRSQFLPPLANQSTRYQSKDKTNTLDMAVRWNHSFDALDLGLSYFSGTQRTPLFQFITEQNQAKLLPVYVQSQQIGLDAQVIVNDLLLKAEFIHRDSHKLNAQNQFTRYQTNALVAGFEYTLVGIGDSVYDLGLIGEYLYDEWESITPFQKDWMTGLRWVFNDTQSTEILMGHIIDLDDQSQIWTLEASRRIGENWKAELNGRWVSNVNSDNYFVKTYQQDDLINFKVSYYF
ncbi:MAG: hypothetical protein L3J00_06180 [Thiomicrorhabdus sp.]|nr:hypothetical protein [Thiomicrorhabdus sp.]